jgi:CheY-like chemotaxis protein
MMVLMKGCDAAEATNGQQAVEMASSERPDLILMDLNLPILDGWEATRRIHTRKETSRIPIVAVSAQCSGNWKDRALSAGARECMEKPLDFTAFDRLLSRYPSLH